MRWGKVSITLHGPARGADLRGRRRALSLDRRPCEIIPPPASGEGESQQARAQQQEAGCRQCEKTVGYQIMSTHVAPVALDAGPNSLKLSESAR